MQPSVKSKGPADAFGRPLLNLRISVTDRCNLRCRYCMPEEEYVWLPREKLLSFEEISELASIFTEVGIEKVRLTGGEPLLRKDLPVLVRMLAQNPRIRDLALTTNGVLLAGQAQALWDAGLHRLTVSLDTLRPDRFLVLTRRDAHAPVLRGIEAARQAGFRALKIDAVVVRGANEDELADLIEFGKRAGAEVRFIEYMDVGGATQWSRSTVVSRAEILEALQGCRKSIDASDAEERCLGFAATPTGGDGGTQKDSRYLPLFLHDRRCTAQGGRGELSKLSTQAVQARRGIRLSPQVPPHFRCPPADEARSRGKRLKNTRSLLHADHSTALFALD